MCTSDFKSTPLSPCYTHVKSRCVLLILNPPPFALLHTCQVSMCTSDFRSTPLSPCYTHVKSRCVLLILYPPPFCLAKSRCVLLILNPPPFRLATHMSSLDVYFLFQIHPPFALLHRCQVSMCTSSFKSTPLLPCYTHVKSRCVLLILDPPPFRLATQMSSLDVYFLF